MMKRTRGQQNKREEIMSAGAIKAREKEIGKRARERQRGKRAREHLSLPPIGCTTTLPDGTRGGVVGAVGT
jgi:hypothetical protein